MSYRIIIEKLLKLPTYLKAIVLYFVLFSLFFAKPLLKNEAISPSDMIYIFDNYSYLAPADYIPSNSLLSDQMSQFEPWKFYAREQIRQGKLPWSNPYQGDGAPFIGNDQSAVFFPTNIMFYLLPINFATTFGAIIRLVIAALGTYLFLHQLRVRKQLAFIAGVMFALAGFNMVWLMHPHTNVSIFLPWLLWLAHVFGSNELQYVRKFRYALLLTAVILLQFLGGHVETSFHICLIAGLYFMFVMLTQNIEKFDTRKVLVDWWRKSVSFAIPILVGSLFALIQLLPFILYLQDSYALHVRSSTELNPYGQPPAAALTWVVPNIFGNPKDNVYTSKFPTFSLEKGFELTVAPLTNFNESAQGYAGFIYIMLAPFALFVSRRRKLAIWGLIMNILIVLITLRVWPVFNIVSALPLFDVTANHRLLLPFGFINILLGSLVLEEIMLNRAAISKRIAVLRSNLMFVMPFVTAVAAGAFLYLSRSQFSTSYSYAFKNLFLFCLLLSCVSALILLYLHGRLRDYIFLLILLLVIFVDISIYAFDFNPTYDLNKRFPVTPGIQYLQERANEQQILFIGFTMPPNIATVYKLHDMRNYDAMQLRDFTEKFYLAYAPSGSWETINYLPELQYVREQNNLHGFNVGYLAVGAGFNLANQARLKYDHNVVYDGPDFVIIAVEPIP